MAYKGLPVVNLYKWMNILAGEEPRFSKRNFVVALHDVCCIYMKSFDAPVLVSHSCSAECEASKGPDQAAPRTRD